MNKNISLVLSSGGARGIAHIGVIEKILEMGYNITSISGTSIGALIGGMYASGNLSLFKEWICSMSKRDVLLLMDLQLKREGFIKGQKVFNHMEQWLAKQQIEDLDIPLSIVTTDILNREEVVFTSGNLLETVRASVAVPGFVAPLHINNKWLFDGGVVNPLPLNRIERSEDDLLVAVDLNAFVQHQGLPNIEEIETAATLQTTRIQEMKNWFSKKINKGRTREERFNTSYFTLMNQMFDMMQEKISASTLETSKPDVLIKIPRDICNTFEFEKSQEMVELGYKTTEKAFENFSSN